MSMERQMRWNDDEAVFIKPLLAAAYGQHDIKGLLIEMLVVDERFREINELPWDAFGEIFGNLLRLVGNTGPSGQGPVKSITLPEDVLIEFRVWDNGEQL